MSHPTKRLRHRIPVRLRHHWKLVALTLAFVGLLTGVLGGGIIRPYVTSSGATSAVMVTQNITGTKDLFDTPSHNIEIRFSDVNYQTMLKEYFDTGEKGYIPADIIIDGTTIKDVGLRLKGNSTLRALTWNGESRTEGRGRGGDGQQRPGRGPAPGGQQPEGGQVPEGMPQQNGAGGAQDQGGRAGMGAGLGVGMELKAEEPETLPWLISFDEFVEGRLYQGRSQIAVRPGTTESSAQLNEALAISLFAKSGEPAQETAHSSFSINGRVSVPRLIVEHLDEGYAEDLGNGVLYKALASGQFTYQGDDQTEYADDFKQINKVGSKDLGPVIDLIKWVEESSDEEFAAGLADRVDVESFARYTALQNLALNSDDMAGPGSNYYLWYDLDTKKFSIISWDMNLAFSGDASAGPHDSIGMGIGRGQPPAGMEVPEGMELPEGMETPADGGPAGGDSGPGGNQLKERFLESDAFKQLYEDQYRQLYTKLLPDDEAVELLDDVVDSYLMNDNAADKKVESEAADLRNTLQERAKALGSNKAVQGGQQPDG